MTASVRGATVSPIRPAIHRRWKNLVSVSRGRRTNRELPTSIQFLSRQHTGWSA